MLPVRKSKTAGAKAAAIDRLIAGMSVRERMQYALYLGHRGLAFAKLAQGKRKPAVEER